MNPFQRVIQLIGLAREELRDELERKMAIECAECPGFRLVDGARVECECRRENV